MNSRSMIDWTQKVIANTTEAKEVLRVAAVLTALGITLAALLKANEKP